MAWMFFFACSGSLKLLVIVDTVRFGVSGVADYALLLCQSVQVTSNVTVVFRALGSYRSASKTLLDVVREEQPDWVSFHFVPYAYAPRGLVSAGTLPWNQLRGRIGTHIYFHELWIGSHKGASFRHRLIGAIQRRGILKMMRQLRPSVVHTSNNLYSAMLENSDIPNRILPLFSSILIQDEIYDPYSDLLLDMYSGYNRDDWVVVALFAAIYPTNNLLPALKWLHDRCNKQSKRLLVVSLGHSPTATEVFSQLSTHFSEPNSPCFVAKGKMDAELLSCWLRYADCGFATTPYNIIDKSASAIALVEHGVPVIVMDAGAPVPGLPCSQPDLSPEFWLYGDPRLESFSCLPPRRSPHSRRQRVVRQFVEDLRIHDL